MFDREFCFFMELHNPLPNSRNCFNPLLYSRRSDLFSVDLDRVSQPQISDPFKFEISVEDIQHW